MLLDPGSWIQSPGSRTLDLESKEFIDLFKFRIYMDGEKGWQYFQLMTDSVKECVSHDNCQMDKLCEFFRALV